MVADFAAHKALHQKQARTLRTVRLDPVQRQSCGLQRTLLVAMRWRSNQRTDLNEVVDLGAFVQDQNYLEDDSQCVGYWTQSTAL